jgi:hypothetical protein
MPQIVLTSQLRLQLREALRPLFTWDRLKDLLLDVGKNGDDYAVGGNVPNNIMAVVIAAEQEDWLVLLVDRAVVERPTAAALIEFQKELAKFRPTAAADPFEVCCLSGSHILVNRTVLRGALRQLASPLGKRVLVVRDETPAPPGQSSLTGKSHSVQLMSYLKPRQGFRLFNLDLAKTSLAIGRDKPIQPSDLARRLSSLFGYDGIVPEDPADAQWARWNLDFCDRFEARAAKDNATPCWVVIDQFNLVLLPQATLDLVKELASRVNVTLDHFRLVLIGYASTLPATVLAMVEEESVKPIDEDELIDFFARAAIEHGRPVTEAAIAEAVINVMKGDTGTAPSSTAELAIRISAEIKKLLP